MLNQPRKGLEVIEEAVQLEPGNIDFLKARAQLANWSGNSDVAADSYRRLAKLLPHDDLMILYLARADVLARAARSTASLSILESLLENDPSNYEILYSRTIALHYARRPRMAQDHLRLLRQLRPQFGFDQQLGNGYWDPGFLQSYMGAMIGYWKISENNNVRQPNGAFDAFLFTASLTLRL